MTQNNNTNTEARDEQEWLNGFSTAADAAAAMEQSLASPQDAVLPEWGE